MTNRLATLIAVLSLSAACSGSSESSAPPPAAGTSAAVHDSMAHEAATTAAPLTTEADVIRSAMSAAPEAVSASATILGFDEKMQPRTVREGTNGWTCMPDMPHTPGPDPMCVDRNGMGWVQAWMAKEDPPAGKMSFAYMLAGGSDASNTDPFAMKPAAGGQWVETGAHVMVLNIGNAFDGYPTTPDNPKAPYVMFPNTPYAHLMLPVR